MIYRYIMQNAKNEAYYSSFPHCFPSHDVFPKEQVGAFLLVNLFEHVQPQQGVSWEIVGELRKLYGFVYDVLAYL